MPKTKYPFNFSYTEIEASADDFIDTVFATLQSSFLLLPRGPGFVTYQDFQQAYEVLKRHTIGFTVIEPKNVMAALTEDTLTFIVLRSILGFTPPELAYVAAQTSGVAISQSFARTLDRRIRAERLIFQSLSSQSKKRVAALTTAACQLLQGGVDTAPGGMIHRLS
jgi:hypothetical protein